MSPRSGARPEPGRPSCPKSEIGSLESAFPASCGHSTGGLRGQPCEKHDKVFSARRIIPGKPCEFSGI
ncbi:hypothetical protein BN940_00176 [Castellaniella defragrans 65Phen]|uniref:Uncharacterized protein n=1 Tax=Castellaniella defragrans (strain DSM 12143 / CCUG 39792 / 65Phen) TaxID=1437824 RepID=W8X0R4_CASD6|nr:hypothetical protein BN940_00176 [Castellaniella defragrans 65Phen]